VASVLIVGVAVRRAIDGPAPLDDPSETSAGPGVRVIISEPLDRPVIAVPEPKAAVIPVPATGPAPAPAMHVTATPPATRIPDAPRRTPPTSARAFSRSMLRPEALSSPADLADDAAAAGMTGRVARPTTEDRP
jgi:hypothetical protein